MKLSGKPISSPGRTDKFPPPLMRFLRSNVGSRSRGRLRNSSPMFVRKKNTAAVDTQEPSSPKVTCMGQVRVRRSKAASRPRSTGAPTTRKRYQWIQNALFCGNFPGKFKPKSCSDLWRKWVPFFQAGCCRKSEIKNDPPKIEPQFGDGFPGFCSDGEDEEEVQGFERKPKVFASSFSASSPPKNALLLTRCRSAPYRSSSLACKFWSSPNRDEETEEKQSIETQDREVCSDNERPAAEMESVSEQEPRIKQQSEEDKIEFFKGLERSVRERMAKSAEDLKDGEFGDSVRPLILTRCKSEPARIAAQKLDPDLNFILTKCL